MSKVGKYSTTSSSRPWFQATAKNSSRPARKTKTNAVVINPIFEEYATLSPDNFWYNIFHNASLDIFPNKFGFKDNTLFYHKGKRNISIDLDIDDKEKSIINIKSFFLETGGISESPIQEIKPIIVKTKILEWSSLNNKEKTIKLHIFINKFVKDNLMNRNEKDYLEGVINLSYTLNLFNDKNVIMDEFAIKKINGLRFYKDTKIAYLDSLRNYNYFPDKSKKSTISKKKTKLNFITLWEKYIDCWETSKV